MISNLIFDIGGVIVDDGFAPLRRSLADLPLDELEATERFVYGNQQWKEVMRGKLSQEDYLDELTRIDPGRGDTFRRLLLPKYQPEVLPILKHNVQYILSLKQNMKDYHFFWLSNLTEASYYCLKDILMGFDGGVYSFQEHCLKPEPEIYEILLARFNLRPEECLFFDDRERNIEAGEQLGIKGVVFHTLDDLKVGLEQNGIVLPSADN